MPFPEQTSRRTPGFLISGTRVAPLSTLFPETNPDLILGPAVLLAIFPSSLPSQPFRPPSHAKLDDHQCEGINPADIVVLVHIDVSLDVRAVGVVACQGGEGAGQDVVEDVKD